MRDGSAGVRIGKPALDHGREGKLSDDVVHRAVLWLILDQADELFLRGTHRPIVPLLTAWASIAARSFHLLRWQMSASAIERVPGGGQGRSDAQTGKDAEAKQLHLFAEAAAAFEELTFTRGVDQLKMQVPDAWPNIFRQSRFLSAVDFVQADRLRSMVAGEMARLFDTVDPPHADLQSQAPRPPRHHPHRSAVR